MYLWRTDKPKKFRFGGAIREESKQSLGLVWRNKTCLYRLLGTEFLIFCDEVSFYLLLPPPSFQGDKKESQEYPSCNGHSVQFSSVQLFNFVWLFATPWTAACQASLSITNSRSLFKLMSIESVMPSNHLILCYPLLLSPSIFPSIRVFSNESVICNRWPKNCSFSFSISPSNEYSGLILGWTGWISLKSKGLSRSSPTPHW